MSDEFDQELFSEAVDAFYALDPQTTETQHGDALKLIEMFRQAQGSRPEKYSTFAEFDCLIYQLYLLAKTGDENGAITVSQEIVNSFPQRFEDWPSFTDDWHENFILLAEELLRGTDHRNDKDQSRRLLGANCLQVANIIWGRGGGSEPYNRIVPLFISHDLASAGIEFFDKFEATETLEPDYYFCASAELRWEIKDNWGALERCHKAEQVSDEFHNLRIQFIYAKAFLELGFEHHAKFHLNNVVEYGDIPNSLEEDEEAWVRNTLARLSSQDQ